MGLNLIVNIIAYYAIFAISVGITSYFTIYRPVINLVYEEHEVWTKEMEYPVITAVSLIVLGAIMAPVLFKAAITGPDQDLIDALTEQILNDNK